MNQNLIMKYRLMNKFFKGFSDYNRLIIFELLMQGEKTVTEIVEATGFSQSKVSNHLKCLRETNLVNANHDGKYVVYSIKNDKIKQILKLADECVTQQTEEQWNCMKY